MPKRLSITFSDDTLKLIENWRRTQSPIPSFNQAVNELIREASYPPMSKEEIDFWKSCAISSRPYYESPSKTESHSTS